MSVLVEGNRIYLSGEVGESPYPDGDSFIAIDVMAALRQFDPSEKIDVYINSPGGWATEGAAIYSLLASRPGTTDTYVEGLAASAASLIAMAGKSRVISRGSLMMIHNAGGSGFFTEGGVNDLQKRINELKAIEGAYAEIYALRTGKTVKQCLDLMAAETWFSAEEAVAAGFADKINTPAKPRLFAAYDYRKFAHAPRALIEMTSANGWQTPEKIFSSLAANQKEFGMTDPATMAATTRFRSIMKAPEADGRAELAEHLALNTSMTAEEAIAILSVSPQAESEEREFVSFRHAAAHLEQRRLNGAGLNGAGLSGRPAPTARADLVTNMKRRHGLK